MDVFHVFQLYKWYQIAQRITYLLSIINFEKRNLQFPSVFCEMILFWSYQYMNSTTTKEVVRIYKKNFFQKRTITSLKTKISFYEVSKSISLWP